MCLACHPVNYILAAGCKEGVIYLWYDLHILQLFILYSTFIMAAHQVLLATGHYVSLLSFRSSLVFFFSPPNLRGHLADRHQTLPNGRW